MYVTKYTIIRAAGIRIILIKLEEWLEFMFFMQKVLSYDQWSDMLKANFVFLSIKYKHVIN